MTSIDHLQGVFGDASDWPAPDLSLEQDIIDLAWHQKEFQRRSSFTYPVTNPDETRLGCVYILPSRVTEAGAEVFPWVRRDEVANGRDAELYSFVKVGSLARAVHDCRVPRPRCASGTVTASRVAEGLNPWACPSR